MPRLVSARLKNFKGVKSAKIDLGRRIDLPVITLVGLNESGKTTLLEGLSHFITGDNSVSEMFDRKLSGPDIVSLIPIHRKAAFSDKIEIEVTVRLDDEDFKRIQKTIAKRAASIDMRRFPREIEVEKRYTFTDSVLTKSENRWGFSIYIRRGSQKKFHSYTRPASGSAEPDLWLEALRCIEGSLPKIAYFPTFLVDLPDRIYLSPHEGEKPVNRYYRSVLQDVLDTLGEGISIEKHVNGRIGSFKTENESPAWLSNFFGTPVKSQIDSVFQKISNAISREIIGSWSKIFQRPIAARSITVEWNIDSAKEDTPYASFYISDGDSKYAVNERSLGFRWFFSFLLFTRFKENPERPTLFLFDEPAANLHAKAQAELLKSFARITLGSNRIVYSTHSHHMIDPRWLPGTHIVENKAIDYDRDEDFDALLSRPTEIVATPYREFVASYPSRTSYFQPIVEKLEYVSPEVIGDGPYLVLEGISDYFVFKYAAMSVGEGLKLDLIPGTGAGACGPLISMMIGRAHKFLLLLDDDEAGRRHARHYRDAFLVSEKCICTLGELDKQLNGRQLEGLISTDTRGLVKERFASSDPPSKKQIALFFSESVANGYSVGSLSEGTRATLVDVLLKSLSRIQSQ